MNGGSGKDLFMFGENFGADTINGFDANATDGQDRLDVSAHGIDASNFAARVSIVDLGTDTLLTIDGTATITLLGSTGGHKFHYTGRFHVLTISRPARHGDVSGDSEERLSTGAAVCLSRAHEGS